MSLQWLSAIAGGHFFLFAIIGLEIKTKNIRIVKEGGTGITLCCPEP